MTPDMNEPTPPPERPLPDEARARIRADLLAHAHDHRSATRRWPVPVGAAAAVALVAGLSFWAISPGGSESDGLPVTGDGTATASATSSPPSTPSPRDEGTGTPTPAAPGTISATAGSMSPEPQDSVQVGTGACEVELENVLKGAQLAYEFVETGEGPDTSTSYWIKGDRFSLCYAMDGSTTVTRPLPVEPQDEVATYRVLSIFSPAKNGFRTVRVAGGLVPRGLEEVFDVAYTFPDGHTEHAQKASDNQGRTFWRMAYAYNDGGGNEMEKPPIQVTVSYSGAQEHYTLQWATDTCAQANHGC